LDELQYTGLDPLPCAVTHEPGENLVYDSRAPARKRFYYQAVLCREELFKAGVKSFCSTDPSAMLHLMLKLKGPVPLGLTAVEYKRRAAGIQGDVVALAALSFEARMSGQSQTVQPKPREAVQRSSEVEGNMFSEDDIAGDGPQAPGVSTAAEGTADAEASGKVDMDGVCIPAPEGGEAVQPQMRPELLAPSDTEVVGGGGNFADARAAAVDTICGMPVTVKRGRFGGGYAYHHRWVIQCPNPEHDGCARSRSTQLLQERFGPRAPEFYLGAWASRSDRPAAEHKAYRPSVADMQAYGLAHPQD
jgi:hypothetical protein